MQRASSPPLSPIAQVNLEIKKRLKILQKSHLMQAHDALMTVLGEIKDTVEVSNFVVQIPESWQIMNFLLFS